MVLRNLKIFKNLMGKPAKGNEWKIEVAKMWIYIYVPIFTWYIFNSDYVQVNYVYPELKNIDYEAYKKLVIEDEDD